MIRCHQVEWRRGACWVWCTRKSRCPYSDSASRARLQHDSRPFHTVIRVPAPAGNPETTKRDARSFAAFWIPGSR